MTGMEQPPWPSNHVAGWIDNPDGTKSDREWIDFGGICVGCRRDLPDDKWADVRKYCSDRCKSRVHGRVWRLRVRAEEQAALDRLDRLMTQLAIQQLAGPLYFF